MEESTENFQPDHEEKSQSHESDNRLINNTINPSLPDKTNDEKLRGDAIGDTMYSERWVLKVLMSLSKMNKDAWSDETEKDLCCLWDMTSDEAIVKFLMNYDFIPLAIHVIQTFPEPRLVEIMVGIIGNMSCRTEVYQYLCYSRTAEFLLQMLSSEDALTLLQVVRLLNTCMWHSNDNSELSEDELKSVNSWKSLIQENISLLNHAFSFILKSSTNENLLVATLDLIYSMCETSIKEYLATTDLLNGLTIAFHEILNTGYNEDADEEQIGQNDLDWQHNVEKVARSWCLILKSLCVHNSWIQIVYLHKQDVMRCVSVVLDSLGKRENFYSVSVRKMEILEAIFEVLNELAKTRNYIPPAIIPRVLTVLSNIPAPDLKTDSAKNKNNECEENDECNTEDEFEDFETYKDLYNTIVNYCINALQVTNPQNFIEGFGCNPGLKIKHLITNLNRSDPKIQKIQSIVRGYESHLEGLE